MHSKISELPLVFNRDTGPAYWMTDILWVILVDGEQSGGRYSVMEQWMRQGSGPFSHVHGFTDECFYVLDGQMDIQVGYKRITAKEGYSVWVPRRTAHGFKVTSDVCGVLNSYTPAGFEQVVKGVAKPAERRELPPKDFPMLDGHIMSKLVNNYWLAEAVDGWATTTADPR